MSLHKCSSGIRLAGDACRQQLCSGWTSRRHVVGDPPPQFSQEEWNIAANVAREVAEADRMVAEHIQAESTRLVDETNERASQAEGDIQHYFNEKLADVKHWMGELRMRFADLSDELEAQLIYKQRLEIFNKEVCHILQVGQTVIAWRNKRLGVDLVYDQPQMEVVQEIQVAEGVREILSRAQEQTEEQIRILRKTIRTVNQDLRDKEEGIFLDEHAKLLHTHRSEVKHQPQLFLTEDSCNCEEWEEFAQRMKTIAEKAITASQHLRLKVDSLIRQGHDDLVYQYCLTNQAFENRLDDLYSMKDKLQNQLSQISVTARDLDSMVCKLATTFQEKQSLLALAETRINIRAGRQNAEQCKDAVQLRLILEIDELNQTMIKLNTKILQAKNALRSLLQTQLAVEDAINVKINSIAIDDTRVIPLRRTIRINHY